MSKEINISCPACNVAFCVPVEFCGETAECDECGEMFKIQYPDEKPGDNLKNTDTGSVGNDIIKATHTVKLSRSGIGMIPEIDDGFQFGTPHPSAVNAPARPKPAASKKAPEKPIRCPGWIQIDIKEPEKIIGLKEDISYLWRVPLMICIPVIFGVILAHFGSMLIVIALVFVITGIVFAIAGKSQKALIVTNQRSIFIIDRTKIEVKNLL
ncbi:MAG: hypothetical protein KAS17_04895 [Victivallaceae bacterium]|nr:hypothetical protein [Victivallaceae bacterium]